MNYMENMPIQPNMIMPFNNPNIINELLYKLNEMDNKIKKLEQRINRLETVKDNINNYNEPDNLMYMI